jgi:hypothetical protein
MPTKIILVGLPINVASPPMEAEYAIPSIKRRRKAISSCFVCACASSFAIIAIAMGSIIRAVVTLAIHMETAAVAIIILNTMRCRLVPKMLMMDKCDTLMQILDFNCLCQKEHGQKHQRIIMAVIGRSFSRTKHPQGWI